jgi:putative colanic acid biosynthesis acetyltransferase WcaF
MKQPVNIAANRKSKKYSLKELAARAAWAPGSLLFRIIPRPFFAIRCKLLRLFGARIGREVHIHPTARIFLPWQLSIGDYSAIGDRVIVYNLGRVTIGSRTTVSQHVHLCAGTHDYRDPAFPLIRLPITIGDDVWVCADAFLGPGVSVGNRAIVAARGVVVRDVPEGVIAAGNPARVVKSRD